MTNKSFLDDLLTLGADALGNLGEARKGFKTEAKKRASGFLRDCDLVGRDEFDAAFAMLAKARNIQEDLAERIARIEKHLNLSSAKKTVKTEKKNLRFVKTKSAPRKKK